jgi:hypothetical protein
MDICLALIPWKLLWGLKMRRKERFAVAVAMSMGVLYVNDRHSGLLSLLTAFLPTVLVLRHSSRLPNCGP